MRQPRMKREKKGEGVIKILTRQRERFLGFLGMDDRGVLGFF